MMTYKRWLTLAGGIILGVGLLDIHQDRTHRITLSQSLRDLFRTDTLPGRVALVAFFTAVYGALVPHLLWPRPFRAAVVDEIHALEVVDPA